MMSMPCDCDSVVERSYSRGREGVVLSLVSACYCMLNRALFPFLESYDYFFLYDVWTRKKRKLTISKGYALYVLGKHRHVLPRVHLVSRKEYKTIQNGAYIMLAPTNIFM